MFLQSKAVILTVGLICMVAGQSVPEKCLKELPDTKQIFEVIPGFGWDNLRNTEEFRVIDISYNECQTTADRKFLIPDGFTVEPVKGSSVEVYADTFSSVQSVSSCTSASINSRFSECVSGPFGINKKFISGSFSEDVNFAIKKQLETNSSIIRISARFPRYRIRVKPDAPLNPAFRKRLEKIAALADTNQEQMAKYESEILVRDFGTDVVSNILVGGLLVKEDYVSSKSESESVNVNFDSKLRFEAGRSFNALFFGQAAASAGLGIKVDDSKSASSDYVNRLQYSKISAYGGPLFKSANFSIDDWENELEANLVAIDKNGDSISSFINPFVLPEINTQTVYKVEAMTTAALNSYYKHNTIFGCTDRHANNFNSEANVDDGTCGLGAKSNMFGGVYQTCEESDGQFCKKVSHINPRTNDYSCPSGYTSVLLWQGSKSYRAMCHIYESLKCIFSHDQDEQVQYKVYWCAPQAGSSQKSPGLLFGGMWNSAYQTNPVTRGDFCPMGFTEVTMGVDVRLCYAEDVDDNRVRALSFGGLFSSQTGNPLVTKNGVYASRCSPEFTKYLAAVDEDTDIYYCSAAKARKRFQERQPVRPPYMRIPLANEYDLTQATIKMSSMQAASIKFATLQSAVTNLTPLEKEDIKIDDDKLNRLATNLGLKTDSKQGDSSQISTTTVVILTTTTTVMVMIVLTLLIVRFRKRKQMSQEYTHLTSN